MHRRSFLSLAAVTAAGTLAACSTGSTDGGSSSSAPGGSGSGSSGADTAAFPVTIKHAWGSTTIEKAPTRIATLGWGDQDVCVALGIIPVGCPKVTWGGNAKGTTDAFDAKVKEIGGAQPTLYSDADGAPIDAVAKLSPELIVATNSGITKAEYDKLSKIAPTIVYPGQAWGTSWQQSLALVGQATGRSAEAKKLTADLEKTITTEVAKYPDIKGKSIAWVFFNPADTSKFSLYLPEDNRPKMSVELGMKNPAMAEELAKTTKQFYAEVSAEKARDLKADMVAFYVEKPEQTEQLKKQPLLGQIPALKSGAYIASQEPKDTVFLSGPTPLNIPDGLKRFLPQLSDAAKKA